MRFNHTFVICAYKESPYLVECIQSLKAQTISSNIIMVTSTPNDWIRVNCEKFGIPLYINYGESGIAQDWNFAYLHAETPYVTIAHQDDIYFSDYTKFMMKKITKDCSIAFSDYVEVRNKEYLRNNTNLFIKKIILFPLRFRIMQKVVWVKRRVLSLGNPICCPSVCYVKKNLPDVLFHVNFRSNVDWETWELLSWDKKRFVYVPQPLMGHRIHDESETSATIQENLRTKEDYEMFTKFWPRVIAKKLTSLYASSEKSNKL